MVWVEAGGSYVAILVVGSVALDTVHTPFGQVTDALGGAASYFTTAASLYDRINLVAVIGDDFPESHLSFLRARNADLSGLQVVPGKTFRWGGRYNLDMNSRDTLFTELGVFADFHPLVPAHFRDAEIVFLANIQPQLQLEVLQQAQVDGSTQSDRSTLRALDTMNLWIDISRDAVTDVLRRVDIVLMAEEEARQYADTPSLRVAARRILDLGPKLLVLKQGSYGALLLSADGGYFAAPSYPLEGVRDPTGAGDAFAGGFLGYLSSRVQARHTLTFADFRRALVHGNIMGSFACEDFSVDRLRTVTPEDIESRYREFVRFTHFEGSWKDED
jgi:sugar/nucleoside kinase (ribokinase family)